MPQGHGYWLATAVAAVSGGHLVDVVCSRHLLTPVARSSPLCAEDGESSG